MEAERIEGLAGETVIDCKTGWVTVISVEPVTPSKVALTVVGPTAIA